MSGRQAHGSGGGRCTCSLAARIPEKHDARSTSGPQVSGPAALIRLAQGGPPTQVHPLRVILAGPGGGHRGGHVGAAVSAAGWDACLGCAVSVQADRSERASAGRRRLVALGLLQALATAVVLVALYYLLPLDHFTSMRLALAGGLLVLLAGGVWKLRAFLRAKEPAVRAVVAPASHRTGYPGRAATTAQRWCAVTGWRISPNAPGQSDTGGRSSRQAGKGDGSHDPGDA
jgi:hypothetical protein